MTTNFPQLYEKILKIVEAKNLLEPIPLPGYSQYPISSFAEGIPEKTAEKLIESALELIRYIQTEYPIEVTEDHFEVHRVQIGLAKTLVEKLLIEYARVLMYELQSICIRKAGNLNTTIEMTKKGAREFAEIGRGQWSSCEAIKEAAEYAANPHTEAIYRQWIRDIKAEYLVRALHQIVEDGKL